MGRLKKDCGSQLRRALFIWLQAKHTFSCQLESTTFLHPGSNASFKVAWWKVSSSVQGLLVLCGLSIHIPEGILALGLYRAKAFEGPHPTHSKRKNIAGTAAFAFRFTGNSSAGIKRDAASPMDNNRQA